MCPAQRSGLDRSERRATGCHYLEHTDSTELFDDPPDGTIDQAHIRTDIDSHGRVGKERVLIDRDPDGDSRVTVELSRQPGFVRVAGGQVDDHHEIVEPVRKYLLDQGHNVVGYLIPVAPNPDQGQRYAK